MSSKKVAKQLLQKTDKRLRKLKLISPFQSYRKGQIPEEPIPKDFQDNIKLTTILEEKDQLTRFKIIVEGFMVRLILE